MEACPVPVSEGRAAVESKMVAAAAPLNPTVSRRVRRGRASHGARWSGRSRSTVVMQASTKARAQTATLPHTLNWWPMTEGARTNAGQCQRYQV